MPNDFFGLQIGMSALYASRRQMEVAAQNVANANTEGYSRQRVNMSTAGVGTVAAVHARSEGGGSGVAIDSISRASDAFLVARSQSEHSNLAYLNRSQSILDRVELTFNEPSETGIQAQLADFWAGWEDLSNNPGSLAARSQLMERAGTLVSSINHASNELGELWRTSVDQLRTVVVGVNATGQMVADLNGAIKRANAAGLNPNELLDRRDSLALELAARIGGEVRNGELGQINIFVGGTALVRGETVEALEVFVPSTSNITTANDPTGTDNVYLRWVKDSFRATVSGGETGGLLDGLNRMLPDYRAGISGPAATAPVLGGAALGVDPTGLLVDYSAAPQTFLVTVDGNGPTTITIDTDLSDPASTPGDLAHAITSALRDAGITGVTASVDVVGANWAVSLTGSTYGTSSSITAGADGGDPLFLDLFGVAGPVTATGDGSSAQGPSIAYQLATAVNLQHRQGVTLGGADGGDFFTYSVADGLALSFSDPSLLAAAGQDRPLLDGFNSSEIADISAIANGPDNTYRTLIIGLGVEAQTVNRRVDIQQDITDQIDSAREGEAGVSIDEEMANMLQFQHTYAAASRMMTAIDEMLNRLINGTGLVGRS
jgi:flagellar hook-associated protein 1 FlgK